MAKTSCQGELIIDVEALFEGDPTAIEIRRRIEDLLPFDCPPALAAHLMLDIMDTFSTPSQHLREALEEEAASMPMTYCHVDNAAEAEAYMNIYLGRLEGKMLAH